MNTLTLPSSSLHWARIDDLQGSPSSRALQGAAPEGLLHIAQSDLPLPVESLHGVCSVTPSGHIVLCLIERAALRNLLEQHPALMSLSPAEVPAFLGTGIAPHRFQLLVGAFEPPQLVRTRNARYRFAAALLVLAACLISVALARRTIAHSHAAAAWDAQAHSARTLGDQTLSLAKLQALAASARDLRELASRHEPKTDATQALAAALAAMPSPSPDDHAALHSLRITQTDIQARLAATNPEALLQSLGELEGWQRLAPSLASRPESTQIDLRWSKAQPP